MVGRRRRSSGRKPYLPISWQLPCRRTSPPALPAWLSAPVARGPPFSQTRGAAASRRRGAEIELWCDCINAGTRYGARGAPRCCSCCLLSVCERACDGTSPSPLRALSLGCVTTQKGVSSPSDVTALAVHARTRLAREGRGEMGGADAVVSAGRGHPVL